MICSGLLVINALNRKFNMMLLNGIRTDIQKYYFPVLEQQPLRKNLIFKKPFLLISHLFTFQTKIYIVNFIVLARQPLYIWIHILTDFLHP